MHNCFLLLLIWINILLPIKSTSNHHGTSMLMLCNNIVSTLHHHTTPPRHPYRYQALLASTCTSTIWLLRRTSAKSAWYLYLYSRIPAPTLYFSTSTIRVGMRNWCYLRWSNTHISTTVSSVFTWLGFLMGVGLSRGRLELYTHVQARAKSTSTISNKLYTGVSSGAYLYSSRVQYLSTLAIIVLVLY